jgi:hypothetical protein
MKNSETFESLGFLELSPFWFELYKEHEIPQETLEIFLEHLKKSKNKMEGNPYVLKKDKEWYKNQIVYCLYVDLFDGNFHRLTKRLDYLENLGITTLWLLPFFESPLLGTFFTFNV